MFNITLKAIQQTVFISTMLISSVLSDGSQAIHINNLEFQDN